MKEKSKNRVSGYGRFSLVVKITLMLLLVTQIAFSGEKAYSQQNISVQFVKSSLIDVLKALKQKTNYEFLYNDEEIKNVKEITCNFTDASVDEVLNTCLANTRYSYKIVNNLIVITPRNQVSQQVERVTVKGKVVDEHGEPLPGATVVIKGLTMGVASDIDGLFSLDVPSKNIILQVSFVGMVPQEVPVKDAGKLIVVTMKPDAKQMEEVVVTGYGNIRKESFTGSSVTVKSEDLMKVSPTNIIGALQVFDPSFRIQTNNQWGSDPNALPEMYIRGRSGIGIKELDKNELSKSSLENNPNLPTFIMDGFQVNVQKVYDLDPLRIESITILKDAAATAMYGSRAANGVVVITTVAPKPGQVMVTYNLTGSVTMPDLSDYNLADAEEKLEIERLSGVYDPEEYVGDLKAAMAAYNKRLERIREGVNTDWLSIPLRNAFNHKHSLYVEGGTDNLRYALDANYNNAGGVMKESFRNRAGAGFALDFRLKNFQIRNYFSYNFMKAQESPYGSFSDYTRIQPYDRPYDQDGVLDQELDYSFTSSGSNLNNPLYEALLSNFQFNKYDEFIDNLSLNWYVNDYWQVKGQFSITKQYSHAERFIDPLSSNVSVNGGDKSIRHLVGDLYWDEGQSTRWDGNAFVYYNRSINRHNLNLSLGMNITSSESYNISTHYRGFPSGELHSPNYAAETNGKPTKSQQKSRLFGLLASMNYSWNDIYLFDASVRFDGSSEFGSDQKWAPFWSGGVGINIHNYEFLKESAALNQLRLRASYGQTGKVDFPPYASKTIYESQFDDNEWYMTGYGVKLKGLGNKKLTWETTNKFNIGVDMRFFELLTLTGEWYRDKTIDLITDVTLPLSSGFGSYKDNLGEVDNRGYEINLRADIIRSKDWQFSLWGNIAHNKNKILKISESLKAYNDKVNDYYSDAEDGQTSVPESDSKFSKPIPKYEEGGSLTSIFAMQSLGIDPATGKELFLNRDGSVSTLWKASQEVIVGNTEPKAQGSFGFNAGYRNFSLFVSFMYEWGAQAYNTTLVNNVENADVKRLNVDKRVLTQRWQKPGDIAPLKNIRDRNVTTLPTSRFVQDNNILSLNAVTASYDFNRELIRKIGLTMLRLEVSMNDIARFSSIKQERGLSYPYAKTVNFSLKANF